MRLLVENPVEARAKYEQDRLLMLDATLEALVEVMRPLLSPPDEALLTGELPQYLVDGIRCGLAPAIAIPCNQRSASRGWVRAVRLRWIGTVGVTRGWVTNYRLGRST
jgi:hypothetical protein